jgi:hypothetical protein
MAVNKAVNKQAALALLLPAAQTKKVSVPRDEVVLSPSDNSSTYEPISSVWEGSDGDLLEAMFHFYATIPPEPILDSTFNAGRFWKGSKRQVVSMDIDPQHKPMIVGDNRYMTGVPSKKYGVVIYDPPHVGPQGRDKSKKRFDLDFGATVECGKEQNWNLSYLYPPFLKQAKRVLKQNGLLLAKITDMVNNHKSKWPHCDFMRMAEEAGFTVCDLIVKIRNGPMVSTKWKEAHHARKRHCYWIVCRNGDDCERRSSPRDSSFQRLIRCVPGRPTPGTLLPKPLAFHSGS